MCSIRKNTDNEDTSIDGFDAIKLLLFLVVLLEGDVGGDGDGDGKIDVIVDSFVDTSISVVGFAVFSIAVVVVDSAATALVSTGPGNAYAADTPAVSGLMDVHTVEQCEVASVCCFYCTVLCVVSFT
jgi:hypothetical protein